MYYKKKLTKHASIMLFTFTFLMFLNNISVQSSEFIGISSGLDDISATTEKMTLKINNYKPDFTWWHLNTTDNLEAYNLRFIKIQEYFGTDDYYLDSSAELGGLGYNLLSSDWDYTIDEGPFSAIVNLSLSGLANDASIEIIVTITTLTEAIEHTDDVVIPFSSAKVLIRVKNWSFTPGARGLAIKTEQFESLENHYSFYENDTTLFGTNVEATILNSFPGTTIEKSYYKWVTQCDYYNGSIYEDTQEVGRVFFNTTNVNPEEQVDLWFSYPKINNSLIVKHLTVIGLFDQQTTGHTTPTYTAGLYLYPLLGMGIVINLIILFVKYKYHK